MELPLKLCVARLYFVSWQTQKLMHNFLRKLVGAVCSLIRSRTFNTTADGSLATFMPHYGCPHICTLVNANHHVPVHSGRVTAVMYTPSAGRPGWARLSVSEQCPQPTRHPKPREASGPCSQWPQPDPNRCNMGPLMKNPLKWPSRSSGTVNRAFPLKWDTI